MFSQQSCFHLVILFPLLLPVMFGGLASVFFANKLKIHSGIQILLNDVWVAS